MGELDRGRFARPERVGSEIHRRGQGSSGARALLEHYASVGCELTPRFLGYTADGRERLSYLPGETGYPPLSATLRSDEALANVARAIRRVHDASLPMAEALAAGLVWAPNELARPAAPDIIGHHDLAPWNIVFDGTEVTGIIDWDSAGPSTRAWDLAYAAYQFVPLHPSRDLAAFGWPDEPDRRERLRLFAAAYGDSVSVEQLVDNAILRIASIGAEIAEQVARRNPLFAVHAEEAHAPGYFRAVSNLAAMREQLVR